MPAPLSHVSISYPQYLFSCHKSSARDSLLFCPLYQPHPSSFFSVLLAYKPPPADSPGWLPRSQAPGSASQTEAVSCISDLPISLLLHNPRSPQIQRKTCNPTIAFSSPVSAYKHSFVYQKYKVSLQIFDHLIF